MKRMILITLIFLAVSNAFAARLLIPLPKEPDRNNSLAGFCQSGNAQEAIEYFQQLGEIANIYYQNRAFEWIGHHSASRLMFTDDVSSADAIDQDDVAQGMQCHSVNRHLVPEFWQACYQYCADGTEFFHVRPKDGRTFAEVFLNPIVTRELYEMIMMQIFSERIIASTRRPIDLTVSVNSAGNFVMIFSLRPS